MHAPLTPILVAGLDQVGVRVQCPLQGILSAIPQYSPQCLALHRLCKVSGLFYVNASMPFPGPGYEASDHWPLPFYKFRRLRRTAAILKQMLCHQGPEQSAIFQVLWLHNKHFNKKQDSSSHFHGKLHEQRPFTLHSTIPFHSTVIVDYPWTQ